MSEELSDVRAWVDSGMGRIAAEEDAWADLDRRAATLLARADAFRGRLAVAMGHARQIAAALQAARSQIADPGQLVASALEELNAVKQAATEIAENELLEETLAGLVADVDEFAATVDSYAEELEQEVEATTEAVTESLPERMGEACESIVSATASAGELFEETMCAGMDESFDDALDQLEEIRGAMERAASEIAEAVTHHSEEVMSDTTDFLEGQENLLSGQLTQLGETYDSLGQDLSGLGTDLRNLYDMVANGMKSSGVGMSAGADALKTAQDLMRGVS